MSPIPKVRADRGARFINFDRQVAGDKVSRGGEAYGAGANDGNGIRVGGGFSHVFILPVLSKLEPQKKRSSGSLVICHGASSIDAALLDKKADQFIHRRIVGTADQRCGLSFLPDQAGENQPVQMV